MNIVNPETAAASIPSIPPIDESDPMALSAKWKAYQTIAAQRSLTPIEVQEMVQITRALRRTNTGPAKAKTAKAKTSKPMASLDDILGD
jgi:hypothetical protein